MIHREAYYGGSALSIRVTTHYREHSKTDESGGYRDSGSDIAYALYQRGWNIATPKDAPDPSHESDWVFADTRDGMALAHERGANTFWTNTVLYEDHPIDDLAFDPYRIGQATPLALIVENKAVMEDWLTQRGFSAVDHDLLSVSDAAIPPGPFPLVVKPVRGRGSQGVAWVKTVQEFRRVMHEWPKELYGGHALVETALPGQEITVAVMPQGRYSLGGRWVVKDRVWALPLVERFSQVDGIMPYSRVVPVLENSRVIVEAALNYRDIIGECVGAGESLGIRAPIRIDARMDESGRFRMFDVNMKPNFTGPGRPGRENAVSLMGLAAQAVGWDYRDLVENVAGQAWKPSR